MLPAPISKALNYIKNDRRDDNKKGKKAYDPVLLNIDREISTRELSKESNFKDDTVQKNIVNILDRLWLG